MQREFLTGIAILISVAGFPQAGLKNNPQKAKDSLAYWQASRRALSSHIDSLVKTVTNTESKANDLTQKMLDNQADLHAEVQKGKSGGRPNRARIDSLNKRHLFLSELQKNTAFFFDQVLIQLDSCIGAKKELERKIGEPKQP